jgi:hypothetical protein
MTKRASGTSWLISIGPSRNSLVSPTATSRMAFSARAHSRPPRQRGYSCRRRQDRYPRGVNHQRGNLRRHHRCGQRLDSPRDKEDPRRRLRRLRWRVKIQRDARAPTAVSTAAKLRRTCSELGKEREGRRKTRAQTRQHPQVFTAPIPRVNTA